MLPHDSEVPYFSELEPPYLVRTGSKLSIVSSSPPSSANSDTLFEGTPSFGQSRKRQRERDDVVDHWLSLSPTLRSKSDKRGPRVRPETGHDPANLCSPAGLETLVHRFLTHTMSAHAHPGGLPLSDKHLSLRSGCASSADQPFAVASEAAGGTGRPHTTDSPPNDNTSRTQHVTLDPLPVPATHVSRSQFDARRSAVLPPSTDHSEYAYTQITLGDPSRNNESQEQTTLLQQSGTTRHRMSERAWSALPLVHPGKLRLCGDESSSSITLAPLIDSSGTINHTSSADLLPTPPQNATILKPAKIFTTPSTTPKSIFTVVPRGIVLTKANQIKHDGLPSRHEFSSAIDVYLSALSSKKLPKALITEELYSDIVFTLKREKGSLAGIRTPQFRFWCRKHFALSTVPRLRLREQPEPPHSLLALPIGNQDNGESNEVEVVTHDGQPVVTKEMIYDVVAQCHLLASHGGRDKTTVLVRKNYSWVPKVLIGDFIKLCPVCHTKKVTGEGWPHALKYDSTGPDTS